MAALTAFLIATTVASTANQFVGQRKAAKAAKKEGEYNAKLSDEQAQDAILRGEEAAQYEGSQGRQLTGAQRTSLAAQGIDIGSGSAADVIANDQRLSQLAEMQIRQNAAREAHGLAVQAEGYRSAGKNAAQAYRNQSYGTLLAGATDLLSIYQAYGKNTTTPRKTSSTTGSPGASTGGYSGGKAHY